MCPFPIFFCPTLLDIAPGHNIVVELAIFVELAVTVRVHCQLTWLIQMRFCSLSSSQGQGLISLFWERQTASQLENTVDYSNSYPWTPDGPWLSASKSALITRSPYCIYVLYGMYCMGPSVEYVSGQWLFIFHNIFPYYHACPVLWSWYG